jgi:ELWxxDGT repeat protein
MKPLALITTAHLGRALTSETRKELLFVYAMLLVLGSLVDRAPARSFGVSLLKDIFPGSTGSFPLELVATNDRVLFTAVDESHGQELWVTDGTAVGTKMLTGGPGTSFEKNLAVPRRPVDRVRK